MQLEILFFSSFQPSVVSTSNFPSNSLNQHIVFWKINKLIQFVCLKSESKKTQNRKNIVLVAVSQEKDQIDYNLMQCDFRVLSCEQLFYSQHLSKFRKRSKTNRGKDSNIDSGLRSVLKPFVRSLPAYQTDESESCHFYKSKGSLVLCFGPLLSCFIL